MEQVLQYFRQAASSSAPELPDLSLSNASPPSQVPAIAVDIRLPFDLSSELTATREPPKSILSEGTA